MDKRSEFNEALKKALKEKDTVSSSTLRLIMAALKDRDIAARSQGNAEGISEGEILSMLQSLIKQRQESAQTYADAGRDDLADKELAEVGVIEKFLPEQMDDEQINKAIDDVIAQTGAQDIKDMGKVMGAVKSNYAGQIDMGKASNLVKKKLAS